MSRTYGKRRCHYCGKLVTSNGLGWASHLKSHIRRGEVTCSYQPWGQTAFCPEVVDIKTGAVVGGYAYCYRHKHQAHWG